MASPRSLSLSGSRSPRCNLTPRLVLAALLWFALAGMAGAADIAGTWRAKFDTQLGPQAYVFEFTVQGDHITGTAAYKRYKAEGVITLQDIALRGDVLTFTEINTFEGKDVPISYTGTVRGNQITFARTVGKYATEQFIARRGKPGDPTEKAPLRPGAKPPPERAPPPKLPMEM